MNLLADFPVARLWPAKFPDRLQLYTLGTPNGVKVSIALEELALPYEAHRVSFADNDQMSPEFLSLNPNNKIPAIIDPNGPGGTPLPLWESGAILLYLAEKTGKLGGADAAARWRVTQWLMFQMSGVGPIFGQVGYFHHFAGKEIEDKRPLQRYVNESKRLLRVLDQTLESGPWIAGDYSIADISTFPWVWNMIENYKADEILEIGKFRNVMRAYERFMAREAVVRGLKVPEKPL
jgi:GST-like protein